MPQRIALIIGAGPAGLTAAYELLEQTDIKPVIFEMSGDIGGISKTVVYHGNRIDIGGHRFFSKSDWVMNWWQQFLPLQGAPASDDRQLGRPGVLSQEPDAPDPEKTDLVMLARSRLSRIYFLRKFFDYPVALNWNTIRNLGLVRIARIGWGYLWARLFPIKPEKSLEDFFTNRFGRELYLTFFKDYTQKVWGVPCNQIPHEWGAQRVKGLSISKAVLHALRSLFMRNTGISQKNVETTLISQFLYPKLGPGQLWEAVARRIQERGGEIHRQQQVIGLIRAHGRITALKVRDLQSRAERTVQGDFVFSSMTMNEVIQGLGADIPERVGQVAAGLAFRDYMTVGLLVKKLSLKNQTQIKTVNQIVPDNWIYIQERDVKIGRLQIYNNWSPYLVKDPNLVWIGLEYFGTEGDDLWRMADADFAAFAAGELQQLGIIDVGDVLDSVVIRMPKAYPSYFGAYDDIQAVRDYTDQIPNLFLIGRNGMHRYNNMDQSMLSAKQAVENIRDGVASKKNIWALNVEKDTFVKKLTAMENLTEGLLRDKHDGFKYNPDTYWQAAGTSYAAIPSVRHRQRFILKALKKIPLGGESFVFDYGCGLGSTLAAVKARFGLRDDQVGGCDISQEAVAAARRRISSPHLYQEFFPDLQRKCDVIICTEVIEHTEQYLQILTWIQQHLAPNGWLILTTQSGRVHASDRYTGHTQHFVLPRLNRILRELGFSPRTSTRWGFPLFTLQKYLTNIRFDKIQSHYLEGPLTPFRKAVFDLTYVLFCLQDWIPFGPQLYLTAVRKPQ